MSAYGEALPHDPENKFAFTRCRRDAHLLRPEYGPEPQGSGGAI